MRARLLAGLLLLAAPAGAARRLSSADFLNLPLDVRALGLAEAAQAVAQGAGAVTTNPAAIDAVMANDAYFTHSFLYADIGSDYFSYGVRLGEHHLGASLYHVGYGTLQGRDDQGNAAGSYGPHDTVYGLTYGAKAFGADLGASLKYLESQIVETAHAFTFDLGGKYSPAENWMLGLSGHDIGGSLKYEGVNEPLPTRVALGAGWRALSGLWLDLDGVFPVYNPAYIALGGEYEAPVKDIGAACLRMGFNTKTPDLGHFGGLNLGVGLRLKNSVELDYAFSPAGDLGISHHLALGYRFGAEKSER